MRSADETRRAPWGGDRPRRPSAGVGPTAADGSRASAGAASVFVSYAREDVVFARRLHDALTAQGRQVWADWHGIPPGADWDEEVARGIEAADAFVFVLGPDSVESVECGRELGRAVEHAKRLFPLLHRDVEPDAVPPALRPVQWIDVREDDEFEPALATLAEGLDTDLEWVRGHTRVLQRALEWDASGRDRAYLLRGRDLAASEVWLAEQTPDRQPTELQARYIHASRVAATRRQRVTVGAVLVALAVAVALSILSLIQSQEAVKQAKVAQARELATAAVSQFSTDPQLGLLLATEATEKRPQLPQVVDILREALFRFPLRRRLEGQEHVLDLNPEFSDDGGLALAASDAQAVVWSVETGKIVARLGAPGRTVAAAALTPDGRHVITAESDGDARIWDLRSRRAVGRLRGGVHGIGTTSFTTDGSRALTLGQRGTSVWNVTTGARLALLRPRAGSALAETAAFTPNGRHVLTVHGDGTVREWNVATGRTIAAFRSPTDYVEAARFSRNRRSVLLTRSDLGQAWLWNFRDDRTTILRDGRNFSPAWFSDDLALRAEIGGLGVRVIDQQRGETVADLPADSVEQAAFSSDGRMLLTASVDGVLVWNVRGEDIVASLRPAARPTGASLGRTGRMLTVGGGRAQVWPEASAPAVELDAPEPVVAGTFDRAGDRVVATDSGGTAYVFDAASGDLLARLDGKSRLSAATFASDGDVVTVDTRGLVRRWDPTGDRVVSESHVPGGRSTATSVSADGSLVVTTPLRRGPVVRRVADGAPAGWFAFRGGTFVSDQTGDGAVYLGAFTPDLRLLQAVSGDHRAPAARVWDTRTGETVAQLAGSTETQPAAAFSPDGRLVVASHVGDGNVAVRVWAVSTGRPLATLDGDPVALAFSSDGSEIVAAERDGTARVYTCSVCRSADELIALSRRRATRALTPQERQTYLHETAG
jgi:WD40 repeat protein